MGQPFVVLAQRWARSPADPLQNLEKQIAIPGAAEQGAALVTARGDEVQVSQRCSSDGVGGALKIRNLESRSVYGTSGKPPVTELVCIFFVLSCWSTCPRCGLTHI